MASPNTNPTHQTLQQAASLIKAGKTEDARRLITEVLRANPNNAAAWYLGSFLTADVEKRLRSLERALAADPNYQPARKQLERLRAETMPPKIEAVPPKKNTVRNLSRIYLLLGSVVLLAVVGLAFLIRQNLVGSVASPLPTVTYSTEIPLKSAIPVATSQPKSDLPAIAPTKNSATAISTQVASATPSIKAVDTAQNQPTVAGTLDTVANSSFVHFFGNAKLDLNWHFYGNQVQPNPMTISGQAAYIFLPFNYETVSLKGVENSNDSWDFRFSSRDLRPDQEIEISSTTTPSPKNSTKAGILRNGKSICTSAPLFGKFNIKKQPGNQTLITFALSCPEPARAYDVSGTILFTPEITLSPTVAPEIPSEQRLNIPSFQGS